MIIYKVILLLASLIAIVDILISRKIRFLNLFIVFISIFEVIIEYYYTRTYQNNLLVYVAISYFSVLFYLIYFRIPKRFIRMYSVYILLFIFWQLFAIWNFIWGEGMENVNIKTYNMGMIFSSLLVLYWFHHKLYIDEFEQLFNNPKLYVGFGILIFYTCSFTILNFINYLIVDDNFKKIYSDLLKIGNIFLSLGYLGAILCSIRKTYYTI